MQIEVNELCEVCDDDADRCIIVRMQDESWNFFVPIDGTILEDEYGNRYSTEAPEMFEYKEEKLIHPKIKLIPLDKNWKYPENENGVEQLKVIGETENLFKSKY